MGYNEIVLKDKELSKLLLPNVTVELDKNFKFSEDFLKKYRKISKDYLKKIIITGVPRKKMKKTLSQAKIGKYVVKVSRLGLLEHIIVCSPQLSPITAIDALSKKLKGINVKII